MPAFHSSMVPQPLTLRHSSPPGFAKRVLRRHIAARTARHIAAGVVIGCTLVACAAPVAHTASESKSETPIQIASARGLAPPTLAPAAATPPTAATPATDEAVFEAICGPGNTAWEKGRHGCVACPVFTAGGGDARLAPAASENAGGTPHVSLWSEYALRDSFTRPGAREMVVTVIGAECEGHATNYGGTLLLDLTATPRIVEYEQGFVPSECKPHTMESGLAVLLCRTGSFAMGVSLETLTVRDFAKPWPAGASNEDVFTVESDEGNVCGFASDTDRGPFIAAQLLAFDWADVNQDGQPDITATLRYAVFTGAAGPFRKHCANQAAIDAFVQPRQSIARMDFQGDGVGKWSPTLATRAIVKRTRGQNTSEP